MSLEHTYTHTRKSNFIDSRVVAIKSVGAKGSDKGMGRERC